MNRWIATVRRALGAALTCSLALTCVLLALEGRWQEALPLHLCSLSAICAALLALRPRAAALDFLWYLGMPGAALGLIFFSPAVSRYQALMNISYVVTHALILLIPIFLMAVGMRPRAGKAACMFLALQGIALCAFAANRQLGTDFLFLMAPPVSALLEAVFVWGYPAYLILLETAMFLLCTLMDAFAARTFGQNEK